MNDAESRLVDAVWEKLKRSEPMSVQDIERFIVVIENSDLRIDTPDQATAATLQVKLRSVLQRKFFGQQENK